MKRYVESASIISLIIHMAETSTNGTVQMKILAITQITPNGKIVAIIGKLGGRK